MNETIKNDIEELNMAENEGENSVNGYIHKFEKPFTYEDKSYKELIFDWSKLSGNDYLSIEAEMAAMGKVIVSPEFSGEFILRMATKACTEKIGSDVLCAMPLRDFNKIRGKARSLMNSAS